jgi:nicotinamide mononucleotide (NMN) deamidase PncC
MQLPDASELIESLELLGARLVIVASGGGSEAISHLVTTPGASGVVIEGLVPYARESVDTLLGGSQEKYCSPRTARRLAMAAWQRARARGADPERAVGVAVAASLRTRRPKRGEHRICAAVQTLHSTTVANLLLDKEARSRGDEERLAAALVLELIRGSVGAAHAASEPIGEPLLAAWLRPDERVEWQRETPPQEWIELLGGERKSASVGQPPAAGGPGRLLFPGSFDPLHEGHRRMARIAEEIAERPVEFELSITNVDKPSLDFIELRERIGQFAGQTLWLTRAATFLEKLEVFPGSTFVLGVDTFVRLADPRYYGGSSAGAAEGVARIAAAARGLIVFGRVRDGVFLDPAQIDVPAPLREIAYCVSQREFRLDISSTELRAATDASRD